MLREADAADCPRPASSHHHGHLLPDLGERSDQPSTPIAINDPQIAVAQVELVQVDLQAATLPVSAARIDLVLRGLRGMSGDSTNDLRNLPPHRVLHEPRHHSDDSRKDYKAFHLHLVLHHIPGARAADRTRPALVAGGLRAVLVELAEDCSDRALGERTATAHGLASRELADFGGRERSERVE